jgi:hypothetical protein
LSSVEALAARESLDRDFVAAGASRINFLKNLYLDFSEILEVSWFYFALNPSFFNKK